MFVLQKQLQQRVWWLKEGDFKYLCGLVTSRLRGSDSKIIFTRTLKSFNVQTPFWKKDLPVYDDEHVAFTAVI